jgi:hypothetical protein
MGGYLSVSPAGGSIPTTANVNFVAGQIVGNMVTVGLGIDSTTGAPAVSIYNGPSGNTDFTLDLNGYYVPQTSTSGDAYVPLSPSRIFDTRSGSGYAGAGSTLGPASTVSVPVTSVGGVPVSASAVVVNIAVVNTTAPSYIEAYPSGSPPPSSTPTVNQNWLPGEVLSTKAIVGVGSNGDIALYNANGDTDVVVDVDGYFSSLGGSGDLFTVLSSPVRLADTRTSGGPVAPASLLTMAVAGSNSVPSDATACALNVVDIAQGPNYLTVFPIGEFPPNATDVNYAGTDTSAIVGNASYATIGSNGDVGVYNSTTLANIVVDAFGYFTPTSASG